MHERVRALDEPAVERREISRGRRGRPGGPEPDGVGVVDEELDRVPEGEEAALDLLREAVTEAQLLRGVLGAVEPPHRVGAHPLERVVEIDGVPPRLVHLAAGLVDHVLVREDAAVRLAAHERDGHEAL